MMNLKKKNNKKVVVLGVKKHVVNFGNQYFPGIGDQNQVYY